jgi:hypothetical protein
MKTDEIRIPWNEEHMDALLEDIIKELEEEILLEMRKKDDTRSTS